MFEQQSINLYQESTGFSGELPDKSYDIHCIDMDIGWLDSAAHSKKEINNYLKSSCDIRLKNCMCDKFDCQHFDVTVDKRYKDKLSLHVAEEDTVNRGIITCVDCGEEEQKLAGPREFPEHLLPPFPFPGRAVAGCSASQSLF